MECTIFKRVFFSLLFVFFISSLQSENFPCDTDDCLDSLGVTWDTIWTEINIDSLGLYPNPNPSGCPDCKVIIIYRKRVDSNNICPNINGCEIHVENVIMYGECLYPCTYNGNTYPPYYDMADYQRIWIDAMIYFATSTLEPCFIPDDPPFPGKSKTIKAVKSGSCKKTILNPDSTLTIVDCDTEPEDCCVQDITTTYRDFEKLDHTWDITQHAYDSCDTQTECRFVCISDENWTPPIINHNSDLNEIFNYRILDNELLIDKASQNIRIRVMDSYGSSIVNRLIKAGNKESIRLDSRNKPLLIIFEKSNGEFIKVEKVIR